VRELRNLIERSLIVGALNVSALYQSLSRSEAPAARPAIEGPTDLQTLEKRHILAVLERWTATRRARPSCWASRAARWSAAWPNGPPR
jgi:hypothetical protein